MIELIAQALYLFLPAYAANSTPVLAKRIGLLPALARPLDGGRRLGSQPVFGPHKTIRGVLVGWCSAVVVALLQRLGAQGTGLVAALSSEAHRVVSPLLWGTALGLGALLGDVAKSFVKRRLGIPPGRRWIPWDQLDMVAGGLLGASLVSPIPLPEALVIVVATPILGLLVNIGSYLLSVKEAW